MSNEEKIEETLETETIDIDLDLPEEETPITEDEQPTEPDWKAEALKYKADRKSVV